MPWLLFEPMEAEILSGFGVTGSRNGLESDQY